MKKLYLATILLAVAAFTIFWSFGVATGLFASKAFSSFWWLSHEGAHYAQFTALAVGGGIMLVGMIFWVERNNTKPIQLKFKESKENKTQ